MKRFLMAALLLGGCTAVEGVRPDIAAKPVASRHDEISLINDLRSSFEFVSPGKARTGGGTTLGCYTGAELKAFRAKSAEGYSRKVPEEFDRSTESMCVFYKQLPSNEVQRNAVMLNYVSAGFTLTDIYCARFFTVVTASEQNRRFGGAFAGGVDTLINSVLTFSNASKAAIGIANGGFGLIDTTIEAYDSAYLVAPDMANVRKLVLAAQNEIRFDVLKTSGALPSTYPTARSVIERYAGLCTFPGMRQLVNDSVNEKTNKIEDNTPPQGTTSTAGKPAQNAETVKGAPSPTAPKRSKDKPAVPVPSG